MRLKNIMLMSFCLGTTFVGVNKNYSVALASAEVSSPSFIVVNKTMYTRATTWKIGYGKSCYITAQLNIIKGNPIKSVHVKKGLCEEFNDLSDDEMFDLVQLVLTTIKNESDVKLSFIYFDARLSSSFKQDIMSVLINASKSTSEEYIRRGEWPGTTLSNGFSDTMSVNSLVSIICNLSIEYGHQCGSNKASIQQVVFNYDYRQHSDFTSEFEDTFHYPPNVRICYKAAHPFCG